MKISIGSRRDNSIYTQVWRERLSLGSDVLTKKEEDEKLFVGEVTTLWTEDGRR